MKFNVTLCPVNDFVTSRIFPPVFRPMTPVYVGRRHTDDLVPLVLCDDARSTLGIGIPCYSLCR